MPKSAPNSRPSYARLRRLAGRENDARFDLRVTNFGEENTRGDCVVYWAQSARRIEQNLALEFAVAEADRLQLPLVIYEALRPDYRAANDRIHTFILESVAGKAAAAKKRGMHYRFFLPHTPKQARGVLVKISKRARVIVTDEYPTFIPREQTERFVTKAECRVVLVDHNGMLPMRFFTKEQYSAKFLRDRAHRAFEQYWTAIEERSPRVTRWKGDFDFDSYDGADPVAAAHACRIDHSVAPVASSGSRKEALRRLDEFVRDRLPGYADLRNRESHRTSELSPYLHFGQIGIHEIANRVLASDAPQEDIDAYLEEAIIRRELSFNFCFYRSDHESLSSLPDWAQKTLAEHARDRRKPQFTQEQIERAETYDDVWNLAHRGLLVSGTIHNYLRMLWGKKIIEWCETPEEAHRIMEELHDRYAIDGRDPNTHAGVLWCFGKHDRPWAPQRPIFGSIRYMSSDSTKRKVDLKAYAAKLDAEEQAAAKKLSGSAS